jgi:hypothetical protein
MRTSMRFASFERARRLPRALLPGALLAVAASGCNPTYAPPVRAVHYGAPGRVREGDVEVGGTLAGVFNPTAGSLYVAAGLRDWVSLEAGSTVVVAPTGPTPLAESIMGWVGPRFTLPRRAHGVSLLLDGELGLGAGVGGELCIMTASNGTVCEPDGRRWYNRTAFGGYQGGGLGFGVEWFSLYGRARIEESVATAIPVTYWPSAMLGVGFELGSRVSIDAGGGYMGYFDEKDSINGWFYQAGASFRFGSAK